jgi:hypothetical protein
LIKINTYNELTRIVRAWASGGYNLLVIVGEPGLAKTRTVREAVQATEEPYLWLKGTVSAYQLYRTLYAERAKDRLVIDDVDSFYSDKDMIRILKCLCETEPVKTLAWHTAAAGSGVPQEYQVEISTCIIGNDFKTLNKNVGALEDRGRVVRFDPATGEVLERARTWFKDREILKFVEDRVHLIPRLSLRDLKRAAEDKAAGMPWQEMLLEEKDIDGSELIISKLASQDWPSEKARAEEYVRLTGRSRATYYRRKKEMEGRIPQIS